MLIKLVGELDSIRGRFDGTVQYPHGGRQFARKFVQPSNPDTSFQQVIRGYFTLASQAYNLLSSAEKADWEALAIAMTRVDANGDVYNPTAKGLYISVNQYRQIDGQAITDVAPSAVVAPAITSVNLIENDTTTLTIGLTGVSATDLLSVRLTPDLGSLVRQALPSEYRYLITSLPDNIVPSVVGAVSIEKAVGLLNFVPVATDNVGIEVVSLSSEYLKGQTFHDRNFVVTV